MDWLVVELMETVDIHLFDECYSRGEADSLPPQRAKNPLSGDPGLRE
jgi:hypothetical protein